MERQTEANESVITAAYYFPNYHIDPRNERTHGSGWTEWELVKQAKPRCDGHYQPRVPLWGYEDEADPVVMERKIAAAADHEVNTFIFDWYYYNDGSFLERCVLDGFMRARNCDRMRFSLMWANHDWTDIHPAKRGVPGRLLYPGLVSEQSFRKMTDYLIDVYFKHPSFLKVRGAPFFSIYDLGIFVQSLGSVAAARQALDGFRERARFAGFPGVHLNAIMWSVGVLVGEQPVDNLVELVHQLGFDSATSYVWVHHAELKDGPHPVPYADVCQQYFSHWQKMAKLLKIPLFPNVTIGWDSTPRTVPDGLADFGPYPYGNRIGGNTPEAFERALQEAATCVSRMTDFRMITLNAWNEWTEGSYLEPDTRNRMAYLEAVRRVVGNMPYAT